MDQPFFVGDPVRVIPSNDWAERYPDSALALELAFGIIIAIPGDPDPAPSPFSDPENIPTLRQYVVQLDEPYMDQELADTAGVQSDLFYANESELELE